MSPGRRGIPVKKIAREFGSSLTVFMQGVLTLISELDSKDSDISKRERCRETCAALWATIAISFDASALRVNEQEALSPLVFKALAPLWKKHCGADEEVSNQLHERSQKYLAQKDARSQIKTASRIVDCLLGTLKVTEREKRRLARRLSALLAHRMLGDIHRLNEIKMQHGIQLSLLVWVLPWLTYAYCCEAVFRVFRLA